MGVLEQQQTLDAEWRRRVDDDLAAHRAELEDHMERLDRGEERMDAFKAAIDANNAMTERIEHGVSAILDIFTALQGFVKVGGWLGHTVKWIAAVVISVGVIYWVWKSGDLPRKL